MNQPHHKGLTPLFFAAAKAHSDVVALLLQRKADPHQRHSCGKTPLEYIRQRSKEPPSRQVVALLQAYEAR